MLLRVDAGAWEMEKVNCEFKARLIFPLVLLVIFAGISSANKQITI